MANPNINLNTRPHWGGVNSDIDNHIELYDGTLDKLFKYSSVFQTMSAQRNVAHNTNTLRIDKLNSSVVKGRRSMEDVDAQRVTSQKETIIVDTMMYIRNVVDAIDDVTAPTFWSDYGADNGTRFAEAFDQAHIIRLQKSTTYKADPSVSNSIGDGFYVTVNLKGGDDLSEADLEANAVALWNGQKKVVDHLRKRNVPLNSMVTIMDVDNYSTLTNHPKALNKDYTVGNGDFAMRRVLNMNGIPAMELTTFPTGAITNHILTSKTAGADFELSADEASGSMIVFDRNYSLITVFARNWTSKFWEDNDNMGWVLDCTAIFTVGLRRADTVGVVRVKYV